MWLRREGFGDLFREVNRLRDELNGAFQRGNIATLFGSPAIPAVNVREDNDRVLVDVEAPGVDATKFDISVTEGNRLTVQGTRPILEMSNAVWHRQERGYGAFSRALTLPTLVDADKVEATYDAGVLRLSMPKAEAAKPRKIAVKTS